ncbi:hypothetical protein FF38_13417 [Lucilia cuprina]|uniref:Coiled-coil domain-containing protein 137 n=1 Tax=Lucilia cuprina TaxID=7375 RepID=A0A0L0CF44_LUCCU|nr:hypothetical protein FF38_13417 [Lucilia cuprina]
MTFICVFVVSVVFVINPQTNTCASKEKHWTHTHKKEDMARKRKIPVRKHHGIRDPLKQLEVKEKKLKNVVNSPPQKDDQKMSYKFVQFKKLADQAKSGNKIKRIRCGVEDKPKDTPAVGNKKKNLQKDGNKFKSIKQMPGEEDLDYIRRVNRITSESLKEAQYEAKYGVKVIRNPTTGEISLKKKPPNEIDELLKQKRKEIRGGKIKKKKMDDKLHKPIDPKLVKELVKQAIKEDEQEKLKEKQKEIVEYRRDEVKFGEIVHAPPNISTLPRKAQKNETVPRPGKKNNLLLKDLIKPPEEAESESANNNSKQNNSNKKSKTSGALSKNQLKGKRKDLPEATRNMLETERQKLVSLYRDLKKSKGIQSDKS